MNITCRTCRGEFAVPEDAAGQPTRCPACGEDCQAEVRQAASRLAENDADVEIHDVESLEEKGPAAETKLCPMCGAQIKAIARKCRFCGEILNDKERATGIKQGVWRSGKQLVMSKGATLPDRCVKTNLPAERTLRRLMYWHPPIFYVMIVFPGLLFYALLVVFVRHKADIRVGLTRQQFARRRWTIAAAWLGALIGIGIFVTSFGNPRQGDAGLFQALAGFTLIIVSGVVGAVLTAVVRPAKIDKNYVWIKGVHPDYLATLPVFPGE